MLIRVLTISFVFLTIGWGITLYSKKSIENENTSLKGQIALKDEYIFTLEHSVREMSNTIATQAQAIEQAKDFEKELNNDETTDNLDVVPADYILKQLHAD